VMCMNDTIEEHQWRKPLLTKAHALGIPRCWWGIEDPNAFGYFVRNVSDFDYIFTTDRKCVEFYNRRSVHYRRNWVRRPSGYWLPLAASPEHHYPVSLRDDAADFVLVAQSYLYWPARRAAVDALIKPLLHAGYTLKLFCPEDGWVEEPEIRACRVGGENYTENCSDHYSHGKIALGINCQSGTSHDLPSHRDTAMTSMRTFEALACGKPLLAFTSTAYSQLGFQYGAHFVWSEHSTTTLDLAKKLLDSPQGQQIYSEQGRRFVLENHTYAHRLARILKALNRRADPLSWR